MSINKNIVAADLVNLTTSDADGLVTGISVDSVTANTNLTVDGLSSFGNVGNVSITGGTTGQALLTDGTGNLYFGNVSLGSAIIPAVYFTAGSNGNNQSFSNIFLANYPDTESVTVFRNGGLIDNSNYSLVGDVLTVNIPLVIDDTIDIITSLVSGNVNTIISGYGNSNVADFLASGIISTAIITTGLITGPVLSNSISSVSSVLTIDPNNDGSGYTGDVAVLGNLAVSGTLTYQDATSATTGNLLWQAANDANTALAASGGGLAVGPSGNSYATFTYNSVANAWTSNLPLTVAGNLNANGIAITSSDTSNVSGVNYYLGNAVSVTGNVNATYFIGNGSQLTGLSFSNIINGTSNVSIPTANGNVNFTVGGTRSGTISATSVAIGTSSGTNQGASSVAIGQQAGQTSQSSAGVAVGTQAGQTSQGRNGVAVGTSSGQTNQSANATAVGSSAGATNQGVYAVAVGFNAGATGQGANAVAIGGNTGYTGQGIGAVAIGQFAGNNTQGTQSVAVGQAAGQNLQSSGAVAVGYTAGQTSQGTNTVAIGTGAGAGTQGASAVAVGQTAGNSSQSTQAVAIGGLAGQTSQGVRGVAVGYSAGQTSQGLNSVAIGSYAGQTSQPANTIIINGSAATLNGVAGQQNSFYVTPIRQDNGNVNTQLNYNASTNEITYGNAAPLVSVYGGTATSIPSGSSTKIIFDVETSDTNGCFNNTNSTVTLNGISTPSYSFAPNRAGWYQVDAALSFASMSASTGILIISIYKNGGEEKRGLRSQCATGGAGSIVSALVYMNGTTDYLGLYCLQGSGSTTSTETGSTFGPYFQATWVRGA